MAFHVSLVGRKDLSDEIHRQVRSAILDRRLRPGDRMPPAVNWRRALVAARATVTVAYERLAEDGFVEVRREPEHSSVLVGPGPFGSTKRFMPHVSARRCPA
jgi:DNA-binding transcriptional MocR family regulator